MMRWATLSWRLSAVFAALLLVCCGVSVWLQVRSSTLHEQEVVQRLSKGLAAHIAQNSELMEPGGVNQDAVQALFGKLMDVNPSVELYLLAPDGRIVAQAAPAGHLKRGRVALAPVREFLAGAALPITGDDPRSLSGQKIFSAAPLRVGGHEAGYLYVVLQGEDHDTQAALVTANTVLRTTVRSMVLVALLGLIAGVAAFWLITRPLRELTAAVQHFRTEGMAALDSDTPTLERLAQGHGEIAQLGQAFLQMRSRIAEQWRELTRQDQQRRELFANISHDLRTPLTSLHGYLETLLLKAGTLDAAEQRRYLEIALGQSHKVGRLAQEAFELARLEYGVVTPQTESFALPDLVQDVFQKFELAAGARRQQLVPDIEAGLPPVSADLGMIERVLTNLLDNAIRHSPEGGEVQVQLRAHGGHVAVQVSDTGPGIPAALQAALFLRPVFSQGARFGADGHSGGLGLVIVHRILQLHGSSIHLLNLPGRGAVFRFVLNAPNPAPAGSAGNPA